MERLFLWSFVFAILWRLIAPNWGRPWVSIFFLWIGQNTLFRREAKFVDRCSKDLFDSFLSYSAHSLDGGDISLKFRETIAKLDSSTSPIKEPDIPGFCPQIMIIGKIVRIVTRRAYLTRGVANFFHWIWFLRRWSQSRLASRLFQDWSPLPAAPLMYRHCN